MSTDRFISGVQLPNVSDATTVRASDGSDYRRTYYKLGNLHYTNETGAETQITGRIATDSSLGEVQVDGTTITVDVNGVITAVQSIELRDLADVENTTLTATEDGHGLIWDNANSRFTFDDVTTVTFSNISENSVLVSGEAVNNQDDQLMSALAIQEYVGSLGFLTEVSESDVTQYEGDLSINESQITFTSSFIELTDISVGADGAASGSGSVDYDNTTGVFTYTPPNLSSFITAGDIPAEVNDLTVSVTWADVPDANITQSSVTQHQAALSITESQISDFGTYIEDTNLQSFIDVFTLPTTDGTNGQVLTTDGLGNLSLTTIVAGGTDTLDDVTTRGASTDNDITMTGRLTLNEVLFPEKEEHPPFAEGLLWYDEIHKTLNYYSDINNIIHEIGIEEHQRVYNNTGSTIPKGKPLYFSGNYTAGDIDVPTVGLADATDVNAYNAQGLAGADIPNNSYGYCIIAGQVDGVDTSALNADDNFFLGLTPGAIQNESPSYPNFPMCLGWVVTSAVDGTLLVNQQNHSVNSFRVRTSAHIGTNLQVDGNLTVLGTQTIASQENISIGGAFNYLNAGDTIGETNTNFSGSGLDDAFFSGHYDGTATNKTYYVRIDATGTPDTFEWSLDNFSTTEATGVAITGDDQLLVDGISIKFSTTTSHTLGDVWSGSASPSNVDTGWASNRNTGTTGIGYTHIGSFFDVSDQKFRMFSAYEPEPEGTINPLDPSYVTATLVANIEGNVTGTVSSIANFDTDDLTEGSTNLYFTTAAANTAIDNRVTTAFVDALGVNYNTLANLPTIPTDLTDLGITDGTADQVLSTDGAGNFTFVDQTGGGVFQPIKLDAIVTVNGQADYTMQISGVNHDPASDFALLVSLNGVIQEPGAGFNTVGSTITFIPALSTGDVVDFIIDLGNAVDVTEVVSTDTLDDVVTRGNSTTSTITAGGFATTSGTSSQFLKADGSVDTNTYLTSETNDLTTSVTWANVPDANITQSSVTQHQAALSITESQISDLQTYLTAESDTLDTVTDRGATTTNGITVGSIDIDGEIVELTRNATGISGSTALDPALGTIQRLTLSGSTTFTDSLANGESITLLIDDGSGNTITWPTTQWIGGSAPTLDTTNDTIVTVWKINNTLYGALVGVAS